MALAQGVQIGLPGDRYSVSPYLQDSYIFLQGTDGSQAVRLDFSFGIKYMRQPWRLYLENNPDAVQVPVDDFMQFRPGVSFSYKRWIDLGLVVPVSYQTAGGGDVFIDIDVESGAYLLDPEMFIRVPILHKRKNGFGLAFASQLYFPLGANQNFVGTKSWQGAVVLVAADWRSNGFCIALNTGAHLREHARVLDTPIEPEWLIRPGISYSFPVGGYQIGFSAEANIGTSLYHFFNANNVDAFQMLLSVQIQPASFTQGVYGAAGGGSTAMGDAGGYGVGLAHFEGRVGYSLQWGGEKPLPLVAAKEPGEKPPAEGAAPGEKPPAEEGAEVAMAPPEPLDAKKPGELPPPEEGVEEPVVPEPIGRPSEPAPPEEPPTEPVEPEEEIEAPAVAAAPVKPIDAGKPAKLPGEEAEEIGEEVGEEAPEEPPPPLAGIPGEPGAIPTAAPAKGRPGAQLRKPRVASAAMAGRELVATVGFRFNEPYAASPERPQSYVDTATSPVMSAGDRANLVDRVRRVLDKARSSDSRILVVGYADKCFEGFPYLANVYNMELTQRRVNAVSDALKEGLGSDLRGIQIALMPMGRRCANAACECNNPDMPACTEDRKVEIYLDASDEPVRCPAGEYWLAP